MFKRVIICVWASDEELDSIAVMIDGYDAEGNFTDELMALINGAQNVVSAWLHADGLRKHLL